MGRGRSRALWVMAIRKGQCAPFAIGSAGKVGFLASSSSDHPGSVLLRITGGGVRYGESLTCDTHCEWVSLSYGGGTGGEGSSEKAGVGVGWVARRT